jgi:hypothetical protein
VQRRRPLHTAVPPDPPPEAEEKKTKPIPNGPAWNEEEGETKKEADLKKKKKQICEVKKLKMTACVWLSAGDGGCHRR